MTKAQPSPEQVFARIAHEPHAVWLDSGKAEKGWSIVTFRPKVVHTNSEAFPETVRSLQRRTAAQADVPFSGGVVGYVGYGAGHRTSPVPRSAPTAEPEVFLARYEGGLCFRHDDQTWHVAGSAAFVDEGQALLLNPPALAPPAAAPTATALTTVVREDYLDSVRKVQAHLAAGDCYQINLSRPVFVEGAGDPFEAYRRLRGAGASHGAFLRVSDRVAVLSNSPESLLTVQEGRLCSIPIKGTRPRGANAEGDARMRQALMDSDKDRAELTMIVDLVRNDLGRVARVGSVSVDTRVVHTHPTLHHASWPVRADLESGLDAWDALAAVFPPGSVTGAPKIRACERIAELEPNPRGVYCGAIGYAADGGDAAFSVAIRVAVFDGGDARYHVGGGIVIDSDPAEEWNETVVKGAALAAALHA